jgi:hypothetical protein
LCLHVSASASDKVFCGGARGVIRVLDSRTLTTVASFSTKITVTVAVPSRSENGLYYFLVFFLFLLFLVSTARNACGWFHHRLRSKHLILLFAIQSSRVQCWTTDSAVGSARRGSAAQSARPSSASSVRSAGRAVSTGRLRTASVSTAATTQGKDPEPRKLSTPMNQEILQSQIAVDE